MIRKKPTEERPDIDIPLSLKTDRIDTQSLSEADLQKRKEGVRQFLSVFFKLFLLFAAVLLIVLLYSFRDQITPRRLRALWNDLWGIEISTDVLDLNLSDNASFASYQGGLVACDSTATRIIDIHGIEEILNTPLFSAPSLTLTKNRFLLFDQVSHNLYFGDGEKEYLWLTQADAVVNATLSEGGVATLTEADGYLSVVKAYKPDGSLHMEYKSPDYFGASALLSNDGKTLVFLGLLSTETGYQTTAVLLDWETSSIRGTLALGERLPLAIKELDKDVFTVVFHDGILSFDRNASTTGMYSFGDQELYTFLFGEDFMACITERHRVGSRFSIQTIDSSGNIIGSLMESREFGSLAASGRLLAITHGNVVEVYPAALTSHSDFKFDSYVEQVAVSEEGTVIALCDGTLYIP